MSEYIIFEKFKSLIPKGFVFKGRGEIIITKSPKGRDMTNLVIYSWINNKKDIVVSVNKADKILKRLGFSLQIYYDILILGLNNISERPTCSCCHKQLEFTRFSRGYTKTCTCNPYKNLPRQTTLECLSKLNPNLGLALTDYRKLSVINKKAKIFYKLYNWMSQEKDDQWIISTKFTYELNKLKISAQQYYDMVVLGIVNELDRPKCPICGAPRTFISINYGYSKTCGNDFCRKEIIKIKSKITRRNSGKDYHLSEDQKENLRKKATGRKHSIESKRKMSESRKGKKPKFTSEFIKYLVNRNKSKIWTPERREKISVASINRLLNSKNRKGVKSKYFSEKFNEQFYFDSSWENKFVKMMEKIYISKDISVLKRCKDIVHYKKDDGTLHRYLPDFYIEFKSGLKAVIEIKPASLVKNDRVVYLKKIAAKKYFKKKGIKYIILTENELFKNIKGSFNIYDFIV